MDSIAVLLETLQQKTELLRQRIAAKGVETSQADGLVSLTEKVAAIQQHIANGQSQTMQVSSTGTVSGGDFVSFAQELDGSAGASAVLGNDCTVLDSAFIGDGRVAVALKKSGGLYMQTVQRNTDGTLTAGNAVLVDTAVPETAAVIGLQGEAAVLYLDGDDGVLAWVRFTGVDGVMVANEYVSPLRPVRLCGCCTEITEAGARRIVLGYAAAKSSYESYQQEAELDEADYAGSTNRVSTIRPRQLGGMSGKAGIFQTEAGAAGSVGLQQTAADVLAGSLTLAAAAETAVTMDWVLVEASLDDLMGSFANIPYQSDRDEWNQLCGTEIPEGGTDEWGELRCGYGTATVDADAVTFPLFSGLNINKRSAAAEWSGEGEASLHYTLLLRQTGETAEDDILAVVEFRTDENGWMIPIQMRTFQRVVIPKGSVWLRPAVLENDAITLGEAVRAEYLGFGSQETEVSELAQGLAIAAPSPYCVVLGGCRQSGEPLRRVVASARDLNDPSKFGVIPMSYGQFAGTGPEPRMALAAVGAGYLVSASVSTETLESGGQEKRLLLEGWEIVQNGLALGTAPLFRGTQVLPATAEIGQLSVDAMGEDFAMVGCVVDGVLQTLVVELSGHRPECATMTGQGAAAGYARLHALNGEWALLVLEDGTVRTLQRKQSVMKTDTEDHVDGLAAEDGTAGETVEIYAAK